MEKNKKITELEKALSGSLYNANNEELIKMRIMCKDLCFEYNSLKPSNLKERERVIKELFGSIGKNFDIEQPFFCDYGKNIIVGDNLFIIDNNIGRIEYEIYNIYKVLPDDVGCLSQETNGEKEVTLITCTNDSSKRIIVKAKEKNR